MTPERRAAASMFRRTPSSPEVGATSPGCQFDVTRTAVKPARRSWDILTFVPTRSGARTASSATPSVIVGPPACAGSASARQAPIEPRAMTRVRRKGGGTLARVREDSVRSQLRRLPTGPGVYLFRDERDEILYVGKAKSLRARVRSYFNRGDARAGIGQLVERVHRIEVIVTQSEAEALHLEQNLVKRHRPRVQRPAARRQVVPVHRGHRLGRVSARDVHPRAASAGDGLLRPVRERQEGARDARRAQPRLPVPALRRAQARAATRVSRASTSTSSGARRRASARSPSRTTGRSSTA